MRREGRMAPSLTTPDERSTNAFVGPRLHAVKGALASRVHHIPVCDSWAGQEQGLNCLRGAKQRETAIAQVVAQRR